MSFRVSVQEWMDLRKVSVSEAPEVYQRLAMGAEDDPAQWIFSYDSYD